MVAVEAFHRSVSGPVRCASGSLPLASSDRQPRPAITMPAAWHSRRTGVRGKVSRRNRNFCRTSMTSTRSDAFPTRTTPLHVASIAGPSKPLANAAIPGQSATNLPGPPAPNRSCSTARTTPPVSTPSSSASLNSTQTSIPTLSTSHSNQSLQLRRKNTGPSSVSSAAVSGKAASQGRPTKAKDPSPAARQPFKPPQPGLKITTPVFQDGWATVLITYPSHKVPMPDVPFPHDMKRAQTATSPASMSTPASFTPLSAFAVAGSPGQPTARTQPQTSSSAPAHTQQPSTSLASTGQQQVVTCQVSSQCSSQVSGPQQEAATEKDWAAFVEAATRIVQVQEHNGAVAAVTKLCNPTVTSTNGSPYSTQLVQHMNSNSSTQSSSTGTTARSKSGNGSFMISLASSLRTAGKPSHALAPAFRENSLPADTTSRSARPVPHGVGRTRSTSFTGTGPFSGNAALMAEVVQVGMSNTNGTIAILDRHSEISKSQVESWGLQSITGMFGLGPDSGADCTPEADPSNSSNTCSSASPALQPSSNAASSTRSSTSQPAQGHLKSQAAALSLDSATNSQFTGKSAALGTPSAPEPAEQRTSGGKSIKMIKLEPNQPAAAAAAAAKHGSKTTWEALTYSSPSSTRAPLAHPVPAGAGSSNTRMWSSGLACQGADSSPLAGGPAGGIKDGKGNKPRGDLNLLPPGAMDYSGMWTKDMQRSQLDAYEQALDLLEVSGLQKLTARLIEGLEIRHTPNLFAVRFVTIVPYFKVTECIRSGPEQRLPRRDLRPGTMNASVERQGGAIVIYTNWGKHLAGTMKEVYELQPGGQVLHTFSTLKIGLETREVKQVFHRKV